MAEKMFPIQGGAQVPWSLAEQAYKTYSAAYGTSQSLERLAERAGFGGLEFAILLDGKTHAREQEYDKIVARMIAKLTAYTPEPEECRHLDVYASSPSGIPVCRDCNTEL